MKDKDVVAAITVIMGALYFVPNIYVRFVSVMYILFFPAGYFIVKIYGDTEPVEEVILGAVMSIGISGAIALAFAYIGILSPLSMMVVLGAVIVLGYIFAHSRDLRALKISFAKPSKIETVFIVSMLVLIAVWAYMDYSSSYEKEADIGIVSWPTNATIDTNASFVVYVKNWNFNTVNFEVRFYLNNRSISSQKFVLADGEHKYIVFNTTLTESGWNLASFDLYINGKYYTNVHIYFYVNSQRNF